MHNRKKLQLEQIIMQLQLRVIRSSDGRRFGLSPIPDKVYNIHFFAYNRPTALSADTDTVLFPEQYKPVLLARARYYLFINLKITLHNHN